MSEQRQRWADLRNGTQPLYCPAYPKWQQDNLVTGDLVASFGGNKALRVSFTEDMKRQRIDLLIDVIHLLDSWTVSHEELEPNVEHARRIYHS